MTIARITLPNVYLKNSKETRVISEESMKVAKSLRESTGQVCRIAIQTRTIKRALT